MKTQKNKIQSRSLEIFRCLLLLLLILFSKKKWAFSNLSTYFRLVLKVVFFLLGKYQFFIVLFFIVKQNLFLFKIYLLAHKSQKRKQNVIKQTNKKQVY